MSILSIVNEPDPVLHMKASEVTSFDDDLRVLVSDMIETMESAQGCGLAGPQVNILKRIFVVHYKDRQFPLINPKILSKEGSVLGDEGCLSLPGLYLQVHRAESLRLKYQTVEGAWVESIEEGFMARIIQHEFDHLEGVLITDLSELPAEIDS